MVFLSTKFVLNIFLEPRAGPAFNQRKEALMRFTLVRMATALHTFA